MNCWPRVGLMLTLATTGCSASPPDAADPEATRTAFEWFVSDGGVQAQMRLPTTSPREYTDATLTFGPHGDAVRADFWSERMEAVSEAPVHPFPAEPGDEVLVEGYAFPSCEGVAGVPVFTLAWTSGPRSETQSFTAEDVSGFQQAREEFCALDPSLSVGGSVIHPDGRFSITAQVFNPRSDPLDLTFSGIDGADTTWQPVHRTIKPHGITEVRFTGTGRGCARPYPWETGAVTLDGVQLTVDEAAAEAC